MPALTTTVWMPFDSSITFLSKSTGAAFTTFLVKVPAATHGLLLTIIAISSLPVYLIPAAVFAASKPFGDVTPPEITFI